MKRIISLIMAIAVFTACSAFAAFYFAQIKQEDIVTVFENNISICGYSENEGGRVTLIVTGPDCTYDSFKSSGDRSLINHIDQSEIADGRFEFGYVMNGTDGAYEAAVLDEDGRVIFTDTFDYCASDGINDFTTTRTAPWMVNYHLTTASQLENGYKGGECGQMVWGIAIAPSDESIVLMGTDTSGIYKSTDGGRSWRAAGLGFAAPGICDIEFHPDNADVAFAAASSHNTWQSPFEGLWRSEDAGETWELMFNCGFEGYKTESIVFGEDSVYVGAHGGVEIDGTSYSGGVYKSIDMGRTWTNIGLEDRTVYSLYYENGSLYAATDNYIYILKNDVWTNVTDGLSNSDILSVAGHNGRLYALSSTRLYGSDNGGLSWSVIKTKAEIGVSGTLSYLFPFGDAMGIMTNVTSNNFFYSTDDCETFSRPEFDKANAFVQVNSGYYSEGADAFSNGDIIIAMDGEVYRGAIAGGVLKLEASSSGISGFRAKQFLFDEKSPDDVMIASVDKGLVVTTGETASNSYLPVDYSPMDYSGIRYNAAKTVYSVARDPRNSQRILISIGNWNMSIIKESLDGGKTFAELAGSEGNQTECLMFNSDNPDIIYAGNRVSYDNGESWVTLDKKTIKAVSPFDGDKVYALSDDEKIYCSTDAAKTWSLFWTGYVYGCQRIHADTAVDDKLWTGSFSDGIKIVTPKGVSEANNGIEPSEGGTVAIYDIAQNPSNPLHLVAGGTDGKTCSVMAGLFESLDGGESWRVVDGLTGSKDVWTVEFHPVYPRVYVGTSSGTFVYEYKKYIESSFIIADKSILRSDVFDASFTVWNFISDKLGTQIAAALYSADGVLKSVELENADIYKNRPHSYAIENAFSDADETDIIKLFIWENQEPLISAEEY